MPSILANTPANRCVACDAVQIVALSVPTSATAHDGPIEAWLCIGQKYVAFSCFAFGCAGCGDGMVMMVSSRDTGIARTTSANLPCSGRPSHALHSALSARAARTQV